MIASTPPADPSWPKYFRQQYEQHKAIGDFWLALATHPLVRRIGPLSRYLADRAWLSYRLAAEVRCQILDLLWLKEHRPTGR